MSEDLRGFLQELEQQGTGEFVRVKKEISSDYEIAALVTKLESQHRVPVLYFEKVANSSFPVAVNCYASRSRLAASLGKLSTEDLSVLDRMTHIMRRLLDEERGGRG